MGVHLGTSSWCLFRSLTRAGFVIRVLDLPDKKASGGEDGRISGSECGLWECLGGTMLGREHKSPKHPGRIFPNPASLLLS